MEVPSSMRLKLDNHHNRKLEQERTPTSYMQDAGMLTAVGTPAIVGTSTVAETPRIAGTPETMKTSVAESTATAIRKAATADKLATAGTPEMSTAEIIRTTGPKGKPTAAILSAI
jgi:hypothetical protein